MLLVRSRGECHAFPRPEGSAICLPRAERSGGAAEHRPGYPVHPTIFALKGHNMSALVTPNPTFLALKGCYPPDRRRNFAGDSRGNCRMGRGSICRRMDRRAIACSPETHQNITRVFWGVRVCLKNLNSNQGIHAWGSTPVTAQRRWKVEK